MNHIKNTILYLALLLSSTACMSEDQKQTQTAVKPPVANKMATSSDAPPTLNQQTRTFAAMPTSENLPRPRMNDFIEGGKLQKRIKTNFYAENSYVLTYQTNEQAPQLKILLLTPNATFTEYQAISVATLPHEGGIADARDIFFHDVDNDDQSEMLIIASWYTEHKALGIDATTYKIFVFDNQLDSATDSLKPITELMDRLGSGTDGQLENGPITFKYKDRQSILDALN